MSRPHILIVGAGGVVGSRLARLLSRSALFRVSLGARDPQGLLPLADELRKIDPQGEFGLVAIDCTRISAERLKEVGCWIVVDCTGAGVAGRRAVVQAAISAHCHCINLDDDRQHLRDLSEFDAPARAMGVAVLTGAGTTPALTHAVSNFLAAGWRQIDSIDVALLRGDRTDLGLSRRNALSSRRRVATRCFLEAHWQNVTRPDTSEMWVEGVRRRVAIAGSVDLDLLVARFRPRIRAWTGIEIERGSVPGLGRIFGMDTLRRRPQSGGKAGGMAVDVAGLDPRMEPKVARWTLLSHSGDDSYLPAIAAATAIVALIKGQARAGLRTAAGVVTLDGVRPWLPGLDLDIETTGFKREVPLFARATGAAFAQLPDQVRRLHRGRPAVIGEGEVAVMGATTAGGRLLARFIGLPTEGSNVAFRELVEARDGREFVTRWFGAIPVRTVRRLADRETIEERCGPFRVWLQPTASSTGLEVITAKACIGSLALPRLLAPRIIQRTYAEADGKLGLEFSCSLPVFGRLLGYRGWLRV